MSIKRESMSVERLKHLVRERAKRGALSLEDRRKIMDGNAEQFPVPAGVAIRRADLGGLGAEWAIPDGLTDEAGAGNTLLYFHGGGYVVGSTVSHRHIVSRIALAAKARVLSVDYALAPENPFPAAVKDAVKAYRWLLDQGQKPEQIALAGDSAGGGLAAATLLAAREEGLPLPAGAALISPWSDLTCATGSYETRAEADPMIMPEGIRELANIYLTGADPRDPLASPNFGNLAGLPPLLIQVGDDEVLLDDSRNLAARAREAGVDVDLEVAPDMFHVWHAFYQMFTPGEEAIERMGSWLAARWGRR
ncbi:MAG: alpha/beta hydrolase [Parvibaculum sp.]